MPHRVHVLDPRGEGRVVHRDDRRVGPGTLTEGAIEPLELLWVERAARLRVARSCRA